MSIIAISAKHKDIGGFAVRRALPAIERRMVGPFVFLDQMGPTSLAPGAGLDVRPHPHIGLSTMTYLFEGEILHRDSLGTVQVIQPGAVNWMTAGSGIAHSERTPAESRDGGNLSGLQFWVALPKAHEEMDPTFVHLAATDLPTIEGEGIVARVIAGEAVGHRSPLISAHPMLAVDLSLAAGSKLDIPTDYAERAIYVALGEIECGGARYGMGQLLVLPPGEPVAIQAVTPARAMLFGGEPMDGPRHIWWNFVSSSKDRIEQAKRDWKEGRFRPVPGETEFIPLPQ
jgi:redox-sensitive bicupin YhaK (pirin superfamily)